MTETGTVSKVLISQQDLALGLGSVSQTRNGRAVDVDKLGLAFIFSSVAAIKAADPVKFPIAKLYTDSIVEYYYAIASEEVADDDNVLMPVSGVGRWLKMSADVQDNLEVAYTIAALRNKAPTEVGQSVKAIGHTLPGIGAGDFISVDSTSLDDDDYNYISTLNEDLFWKRISEDDYSISSAVRDVMARTQSAFGACALYNGVMIQKLRESTYCEFCVYFPLTVDGFGWGRALFTERFNDGNYGSSRCLFVSYSSLFKSGVVARTASNKTTGTTGTAPTTTYASAASTNTGTWTAPTTIGSTTDVSYSVIAGDKRVWTITGDTRITMRCISLSNGGIGNVKIYTDVGLTTEISSDKYLVPVEAVTSRRLVYFSGYANNLMHTPLAKDLTPATTYYVVITVDATNPALARVYTAGLLGYAAAIAYNATGIHGVVDDAELPGVSGNFVSRSYTSGTTAVYLLEDVTKIFWSYVQTTSGSIVQFKIYNSSGVEISEYENSSVDTYATGSTEKELLLAIDLPEDDYYVMVTNGMTRNASNTTGYRYYDNGVFGFNQNKLGVFGTDRFDTHDVPLNVQDPKNDNGLGSEYIICGTGNLELALSIRKPGTVAGTQQFVGGIHGWETKPTVSFYVDDAVIDYAAMSAYDTVVGKDCKFTCSTNLYFPEHAIWKLTPTVPYIVGDIVYYAPNSRHYQCNAAPTTGVPSVSGDWTDLGEASLALSVAYNASISQNGYLVKVLKTALAEFIVHKDYALMLVAPNTDMTQVGKPTQGVAVGGGFKHVCSDKNYLAVNFDGSGGQIQPRQSSVAFVNKSFLIVASIIDTNYPVLFKTYPFSQGSANGEYDDRGDREVKVYIKEYGGDYTNGITMPVGTAWGNTKLFKFASGNYEALLNIV